MMQVKYIISNKLYAIDNNFNIVYGVVKEIVINNSGVKYSIHSDSGKIIEVFEDKLFITINNAYDYLNRLKTCNPEVVYAVRIIEVEFGQRDEGWQVYTDLEQCKKDTIASWGSGGYSGGGGYYGPERPLCCVEVPFEYVKEEVKNKLLVNGKAFIDRGWSPRFVGKSIGIG